MKKTFIILSFLSLAIIANAQWVETSGPYYCDVACLAASGDTVFAGAIGALSVTSNYGNTWTLTGLTNCGVSSIAISGKNIFAAAGFTVELSTNGGTTWALTGMPDTVEVWPLIISHDTLYAGTMGWGVYRSTNNGVSWSATSVKNMNVMALAKSGSRIFAGGYGIYMSSDNGNTWTEVDSTFEVYSIAIKGNDVYAGTINGVYLSTNNGSSWTAVNTGLTNLEINALIVNGNDVYAGTNSSGVFKTPNNGTNWIAENSGLTNDTISAFAINGIYLYAGTNWGVYRRPLSQMAGVEEMNENNSISVYPNPSTNSLTIESPQKSTIEILNIQGQTILQQQIQQGKTNIDMSGLSKGVYILRLNSNDKTAVTKIVKE